jgi:nickel/cobalt transporter (NicO) family protein
MDNSLFPLLFGTISIAFLHSLLGPDHYIPFIMLSKAQNWSKTKLIIITLISGIGHVGSSILLGSLGIMLGFGMNHIQGLESYRGDIGVILLIGFGVAYALWGLRHVKHHKHIDLSNKKIITFWTLFAVFVLGPCEPLVPLMFAATRFGWSAIFSISLIFSIITIVMMVGLSYLGSLGINLFKDESVHKYSHTIAGSVIALTGVFLIFIP